MNEKSIILHAHEIRRLLDAGEAQIWRPMKPQPENDGRPIYICRPGGLRMNGENYQNIVCPYQPGERRWVKERFQVYDVCYDDWTGGYEAGYVLSVIPKEKPAYRVGISYAADGGLDGSWRSAVHMPRWASRLTVEILDVEARQVWEITNEEAIEAGFPARDEFTRDWFFRYFRYGLGWHKNPWAWVIRTKAVTGGAQAQG